MTLPSIFPPASLPAFLAAGHGIRLGNDYAPVPRGRGHTRLRPKSSGAPRIVPVSWRLTEAQAADFDFWIEHSLNRATRHFTAEVANQGPGQLFWDAVWVAEPRCEPQVSAQGLIWTVSGSLLLSGEGEAARPVTGDIAAEIDVALLGGASIYLPDTPLAAEIIVALEPITVLRAEIVVALLSSSMPLSTEITVALDGSGAFSASGGGGTGGTTMFVGEVGSSDLREVSGILFPDDSVEFDTDGNAIFKGAPYVRGAAWDGAGFQITTGTSLTEVPFLFERGGTITKVTVLTRGGTGSCVIDLWIDSYANYPPTVADTVTASAKPTISSGTKYQDSALTGWTRTVAAGATGIAKLESSSVFTFIEFRIEVAPT